jgi:circadian clock protein KaiC
MDNALNDRIPSGIQGFDDILRGGLPRGCLYLIQGDPGSGKTTLALQFLLEGIRQNEKVLYITLSESKDEMFKVAQSHGWSLNEVSLLEMSAIQSLLEPEAQTTVFHSSEMELGKVSRLILDEVDKLHPTRVVFDSLSEFRLLAETSLRYRRQLLNFKQAMARRGATVLLLDDKVDNTVFGKDPHVLSLTHGVVEMEQLSPDYGASRRRLRILKMRGVSFSEGYHDYTITTGGIQVFPRLVASEHHEPFDHTPVPSGITELDGLLGGGLDRGTTSLILGSAGTGKSTLAIQYVIQTASMGERALLFTFDETRSILLNRARGLGLDLEKYLRDGLVEVQQVDPAELSPGEFARRVQVAVKDGAKTIVIDSLNGYLNAMPGEKYLNNQLHELCSFLNQQGVITILIMAQHGLLDSAVAPIDLSYLADTVVTIRFFEVLGTVHQALAVLKKRSGHHEKTIREFQLNSATGIRIGEPIREFQGILTGLPSFHGQTRQMISDKADE